MTPEAIRIVSQLRQEFYSLFAAAIKVPVNITQGNSYSNNLSMASWVDSRKRLNYLCVYAHTAPDVLVPDRPFILRVAVNKGADIIAVTRRGKGAQGLNRSWHFELTLLPDEILEFLPWVVSLVKSHENSSEPGIAEPPHPLDFERDLPRTQSAWTHQASSQFSHPPSPQGRVSYLKISSQKRLG